MMRPKLLGAVSSWAPALLAVAALVLAAGVVPHAHSAGGPALWNQEHDLGALATLSGVAMIPEAPAAALVVVAAAIAALPAPFARRAARRTPDSRAPPVR